jgi:hypothetical protein
MRKFSIYTFLACGLLAGCGGGSITKMPVTNSTVTNSDGGSINICRPSSVVRFGETPSLFINDKNVAEISNGTSVSVPIGLGETYEVGTKANPLLFRMSDETLLKGKATNASDRFIIIEGLANLSQGISVLLGGAVGASINSELEDTGTANWSVKIVDKSDFPSDC